MSHGCRELHRVLLGGDCFALSAPAFEGPWP